MKNKTNEMLYSEKDMSSILKQHIIYSVTDVDGIITDVSDAFCKETGYDRYEMLGKTHSFLRAPNFNDAIYSDLWTTIRANKIWEGEIKNIRKDGEHYWTSSIIQALHNPEKSKVGYLCIRTDITKEKACEELSMQDELTGAYNRRKFNLELNSYLINYHRYDDRFSLVMIDIDHFKYFNDKYGHLVGDEVIKRVCDVMRQNIREGDLFARWGGEEFVLILNKVNKDTLEDLCMKLLNKVRLELSVYLKKTLGLNEELTCSFGLTFPKSKDSKETLLKRVDKALYQAKENGRNRLELL
ncbi:sensor domain-containing diguanylate cyclase [Sulfurimonas sp. MAG313]|nr:sensor domain-containing diguanylate cyclase [Sulfurimonas sp. MAG313]MDF1880435.1 sensor domain-containing diguanylate cyclase [Sulfurimonas sp. MAG313]